MFLFESDPYIFPKNSIQIDSFGVFVERMLVKGLSEGLNIQNNDMV